MDKLEISLTSDDLDKIDSKLDKLVQDAYSETAVIPTGTKIMLKSAILDMLKTMNNNGGKL